eukprot:TRINITY_DN9070_c0_g1_i3.p1 TRINITY_DN9070_c0_g1~~TRINITY_DN9070_c0_g1_i3.p1  ORF type:complete len:142 (-),score=22.04 TRINITY_DN9070_c0_g1_i3:345-770(-)
MLEAMCRLQKLVARIALEFYKAQQARIEKKVGTKEKAQSVSLMKAYARLGFLYEFSSETSKSFAAFKKCHSLLRQLLLAIQKEYDVWEIKAFADTVMQKIQGHLSLYQEFSSLFEAHYSTFKCPIELVKDKEKYMVKMIIN